MRLGSRAPAVARAHLRRLITTRCEYRQSASLAALLLASATGFAPRTPLQHSLRPLAASPLQLRPVLPRARKSPPIVASAADAAAEAPAAEATKPKEWDEGFRKRRLLIFAFTVVAYACFYLTRNSLYYTAPAVAAPELNLDITSIGIITSIFPLFYGCSKFVSGVVGDVLRRAMLAWLGPTGAAPPRRRRAARPATARTSTIPHFPTHHLHHLQAVVNIMFGLGSRCRGSACCGPQRHPAGQRPGVREDHTSWFATKERGTYWKQNISHNPRRVPRHPVLGTAARALGWRWGVFRAPASSASLGRRARAAIVRNSPEDIDASRPGGAGRRRGGGRGGGGGGGGRAVGRRRDGDGPRASPWKPSCSQPAVWLLAFTFLFVYPTIRQALTSWWSSSSRRRASSLREQRRRRPPPPPRTPHRRASTAATAAPPPPPPLPPASSPGRLPTFAQAAARVRPRARRADGSHREALGQTHRERGAGRGPRRQAAPRCGGTSSASPARRAAGRCRPWVTVDRRLPTGFSHGPQMLIGLAAPGRRPSVAPRRPGLGGVHGLPSPATRSR